MPIAQATLLRLECQLETLPVVLGKAAADDALARRPPSGRWSALENLAHLARHHEVMLERLSRMRRESAPTLPAYRAETDPAWPRWAALPATDVLARLRALRAELVAAVRSLGPAEGDATGVHSSLGSMSVPEWLEFFLVHEAHHLYVAMKRVRGGE